MSGKSIEDLRTALFDAIEGVKAGTLELDKARTINEIAKTLTETAKVEVAYLHANNGGESSFIASAVGKGNLPEGLPAPPRDGEPPNGITGVTRHMLRG